MTVRHLGLRDGVGAHRAGDWRCSSSINDTQAEIKRERFQRMVENLNTHLVIYTVLKQAVEKGDMYPESDVDKHVAKLFL